MYETQYNYYDEEQSNNNSNNQSIKKIAAVFALSTVILGGAAGFGGAYLWNSMNQNDEIVSTASETNSPIVTHTSSSQPESTEKPSVSLNSLISSGDKETLTTKQIVEKVSPSVVSIQATVKSRNGIESGTGTGIILNTDGYIITNAHVIQSEVTEYEYESDYNDDYGMFDFFFGSNFGNYKTVTKNADKITVVFSNDDSKEYEAKIIGADENSDIAVIKIDAADLDLIAAEFGDSDELTMGDKAIAIGYPMGLGLSTSEGIISGLNRTLDVELSAGGTASMTLLQTDAAINPGNSGGPLINDRGQVIGITSSKLVDGSIEGLGFAIPISDAMPLITDIINQGYVTNRTPLIGITGTNINNALTRYYNLPVESGVMVVSVSEGSGASEAGIQVGDVIIAVDGKEIKNMEELTKAKNSKEIGDTITVTLARATNNEDVVIILKGESDISE